MIRRQGARYKGKANDILTNLPLRIPTADVYRESSKVDNVEWFAVISALYIGPSYTES